MKNIKHWRKKLKKTLEDGKTAHIPRPAELILWKLLYYRKHSMDST
jgi:hypothetical protein